MTPFNHPHDYFREQAIARARLRLTSEMLAYVRAARRARALRRADLEREWARLHNKDIEERPREERLQRSLERQIDLREDLEWRQRQYTDSLMHSESHHRDWEEQRAMLEAPPRRLRANVDGPGTPVGLQRDVRANPEEEDDARTRTEVE